MLVRSVCVCVCACVLSQQMSECDLQSVRRTANESVIGQTIGDGDILDIAPISRALESLSM